MGNTFLVSAHGRSGSKWLARELNNCSWDWLVEHEAKLKDYRGLEKYGSVCGYNRPNALSIPGVDTHGVLIRHPLHIARSAYYRTPYRWAEFLRDLRGELENLDRIAEAPGSVVIEFWKMIYDAKYLAKKARELGIDDFDPHKINFAACNSSPRGELPPKLQKQVRRASDWFTSKWISGR